MAKEQMIRRKLILNLVAPTMKEHLDKTKIKQYLFNPELGDRIKCAKVTTLAAEELRRTQQPKNLKPSSFLSSNRFIHASYLYLL